MFHITKIYKFKPKNKKYSNILIGIKDESMKGSKEILIKGLAETGDIAPAPDKLDILIQEFREFKQEMYEFKANQEKFNQMVIGQFKQHGWIK